MKFIDSARRKRSQSSIPPRKVFGDPGYYSLLIEDPAGIRIEFNHVPGKGLLDGVSKFNPVDYR